MPSFDGLLCQVESKKHLSFYQLQLFHSSFFSWHLYEPFLHLQPLSNWLVEVEGSSGIVIVMDGSEIVGFGSRLVAGSAAAATAMLGNLAVDSTVEEILDTDAGCSLLDLYSLVAGSFGYLKTLTDFR